MGQNGRLLVRLCIGHSSEVLDPKLPNGHTHRWSVFVRTSSHDDFKDRSFVEKVCFTLHPDFNNPKRIVRDPPFQVSETGYAGFAIPLQIWLGGKQYKVNYDLNLTMEKCASYYTTTTISVADYTPEFYSIAKRFGAEKMKRSREKESVGLFGMGEGIGNGSCPPEKIRKKDKSSDVSARNSPAHLSEEGKVKKEFKEMKEESINKRGPSPSAKEKKRDDAERKRAKDKLLEFTIDRARPSPSQSPALVVEKKKEKEEKKKDSSLTSLLRSKKEERKKEEKDNRSQSPTVKEKKKEKEGASSRSGLSVPSEKEKKKDKGGERVSAEREKDKERKEKKDDKKEKAAERMSDKSGSDAKRDGKTEKDADRRRKERKEGKKEKEIEREMERAPNPISPPPVLARQELNVRTNAMRPQARSVSPPTLIPMSTNGRASSSSGYGGSSGSSGSSSAVATPQSHHNFLQQTGSSGPPSLLSAMIVPPFGMLAHHHQQLQMMTIQNSPSESIGGETPSEKTVHTSISPVLRNEETGSSGGSSTSSISSERRDEKRKSASFHTVDPYAMRRRIDGLTDGNTIALVANLLFDLDESAYLSYYNASSCPSLEYDLSNIDQKDLLKLDSILNGS